MNRVILIENLANEPEFKTTQSGIAQCTFRLAVQRKFANAQGVREADFIPVICWRQTAELAHKFLGKGKKCAIEGAINTRSYTAQDGTKRYVTEVIADSVEFLTPRSGDAGPTPPPEPEPTQGADTMHQMGFTEVEDDDLPF